MSSEQTSVRTLEVRGPYDLFATLHLNRIGPHDPTTKLSARELWRAARLPDGPATLRAVIAEPGRIEARAWGPAAEAMLAAAPALLGLEDDPTVFQPEQEALRRLWKARRGLRIVRVPDPLRVLLQTILEQRVRWKDAARSFRQLVLRHGAPAPGPHPELRVLPLPRTLSRLPLHEYAALGVEQKRAKVITAVCMSHRRVQELLGMPFDAAEARLRAFPGVGPWTAGNVLGHALGHADAVPVGDLDLPHSITYLFTGRVRGDDEQMLELLEPFRPHRWRVIRLVQEAGLHPPRTRHRGRLGPTPGRRGH